MVWALMQSIGEVTTMFPIAGGFIEVGGHSVELSVNVDTCCSMLEYLSTLRLALRWLGCIISCGAYFLEVVRPPTPSFNFSMR